MHACGRQQVNCWSTRYQAEHNKERRLQVEEEEARRNNDATLKFWPLQNLTKKITRPIKIKSLPGCAMLVTRPLKPVEVVSCLDLVTGQVSTRGKTEKYMKLRTYRWRGSGPHAASDLLNELPRTNSNQHVTARRPPRDR